ncbi:hypothetical protein OIU84_023255 [Salix udensis]|uniref:Uncharacterized protein n=1 Tax=Salix udensis TaxID=889485 RepID=A0AAD6KRW6_9ROSI|nr:hypothetical protein OIU84_023255 [Salix udensis]
MKKTKMILHILYLTVAFIFAGLILYKFIYTWIFIQSKFDRSFNDDCDRVWKGFGFRGAGADNHGTLTNLIIDGTEIKSAEMLKDSGIGVPTWRSLGTEIKSAKMLKDSGIGVSTWRSLGIEIKSAKMLKDSGIGSGTLRSLGIEIKSAEMLKDSGIGSGTLRSLGIEIKSAGTQKNIDIGIKIMCSLVLAFFLS